MDPNSANQMWSEWEFQVFDGGKIVPRTAVDENIARWFVSGFGHAGAREVKRTVTGWLVKLRIEGVPAHDPGYLKAVQDQFQQRFVEPGWGPYAWSTVRVRVLAGDLQNGTPRPQWVSIPTIPWRDDDGNLLPQI